MSRSAIAILPNAISLSRLLFAAIFMVVRGAHARLLLLALAAFTDGLDGWVARRSRTTSKSGALIDAIADRVFVLAAVSALLADGGLNAGQALVLLARDIATVIGFLVARVVPWLRAVTFKARLVGKAVTVLQFLTLASALLWRGYLPALLWALGLAGALAIADYTLALWRARSRK